MGINKNTVYVGDLFGNLNNSLVFHLPPLKDVEGYIDTKHHLPEMPSAEEMSEKEQNLGEMNKLLVKKIEELTLYMIDLKKDNNALKRAQDTMNKKLKRYHIN